MFQEALAAHIAKLKELEELPRPHDWPVSGSIKHHTECIRILRGLIEEEDEPPKALNARD